MSNLSEQLRAVIDQAAEPITLEEVTGPPLLVVASSPPPAVRGRRLALVAAVVLFAAGVTGGTLLLSRHSETAETPATMASDLPYASLNPTSFPSLTQAEKPCGADYSGGITLDGPDANGLCVGIVTSSADQSFTAALVVDGERRAALVYDQCTAAAAPGRVDVNSVDLGGSSAALGAVNPAAEAVRLTTADGQVIVARTFSFVEFSSARFFAARLPSETGVSQVEQLDGSGYVLDNQLLDMGKPCQR